MDLSIINCRPQKATLFLGMKTVDYVFKGPRSDELRTRVKSWIDQKWAAWGEENPRHDLTDFIDVC